MIRKKRTHDEGKEHHSQDARKQRAQVLRELRPGADETRLALKASEQLVLRRNTAFG